MKQKATMFTFTTLSVTTKSLVGVLGQVTNRNRNIPIYNRKMRNQIAFFLLLLRLQ